MKPNNYLLLLFFKIPADSKSISRLFLITSTKVVFFFNIITEVLYFCVKFF